MTSYVLPDRKIAAPDVTVSDLQIMSCAQNYRRWMYRRISPFLGRRILEVGGGIGNFTSLLLDRDLIVSLDTHPDCVRILRQNFGDHENLKALQLNIAESESVEQLKVHEFDTVICFNVLEHIENDTQALSHMFKVLQPAGKAILLVPAFSLLYGTVDESLGHFRRYSKKELIGKMKAAGFAIEANFYINVPGLFGWFLNNRILKKKEESSQQILFFDRFIAPFAELVERWIPPPAGLSLIVVGKKGSHRNGHD